MSATTFIDPEGDVILELEGARLLVSSHVLRLASPVFNAMFKTDFQEGSSLASKDQCTTVPLPEDDTNATVLFCKAVHHQLDRDSAIPTACCLENLAFFCDKYQCAKAVTYHGTVWIQDLMEKSGLEDLYRLLVLAYVLDTPVPFSRVSWELIQRHSGSFRSLMVASSHPFIRCDLRGSYGKPLLSHSEPSY